MFKSLEFDGINSLDYGVHINGEGVYNAPERDVEMISIPGRNGEYALDHGRFHNIDVTYPAGIGEMSQEAFSEKLRAFRNQLASRRGYYRLEDDYHPEEYRMGIYKSGLEAVPVMHNRAGEFDLIFNCKPQRFLKSGETAVEFTEGGTINNPTLFESKPLLELYGYGTLDVNGFRIKLNNDPLGNILLLSDISIASDVDTERSYTFLPGKVRIGDTITVKSGRLRFQTARVDSSFEITNVESTRRMYSNCKIASDTVDSSLSNLTYTVVMEDITFTAGTAKKAYINCNIPTTVIQNTSSGQVTNSVIWYAYMSIDYDGDRTFTVELDQLFQENGTVHQTGIMINTLRNDYAITVRANSTISATGQPLYLDCEIGEAYKIVDNEVVLVNKNIEIPSDLPVLSPGDNEITFDDTFDQVNVIPRWWII